MKAEGEINIDISTTSEGEDFEVKENVITLNGEKTYILTGTSTDKSIVISSSCSLTLNGLSLSEEGGLTPIVINENCKVSLILSGESNLQDSSQNTRDGVIYLNTGAELTITGSGSLNIIPNKYMAINGTVSTFLTMESGNIQITSSSSVVGGIYLRKGITINGGTFSYNVGSGIHHAIDTEGSITITKGNFNIISGNGKGLQAENNLFIGEEGNSDSDLTIIIKTSDEGIEAKGIEIYSGTIIIEAGGDGINAANDDVCNEQRCSGNCKCYIKFAGGNININSDEDGIDSNGDITITGGVIVVLGASNGDDQPIDQDGLLTISGATVLAAGTSSMGGVEATTSQVAAIYTEKVSEGSILTIFDNNEQIIMTKTTPKDVEYLYFTYPGSSFTMKLNGNQIETSDPSTIQQNGPNNPGNDPNVPSNGPNNPGNGPFNSNDPNNLETQNNKTEAENISQFIKLQITLILLKLLLL